MVNEPLTRTRPQPEMETPSGARPLRRWFWAGLAAVLAVLALRLVNEPRFLYWDDTQLGAYGQWYGLGSRILSGDITLMSPGAWQGGNYLAEGQWGIWNPVTWLVALSTHAIDSATVTVTLIKLAFFTALYIGAYLVAREYGATPWWAMLGGFTATMGGQTIFMDGPSWVTGLQSTALFALSWWALKRHLDGRSGPVPFFVFAYVLITFGYVFGVMELAFLLLVSLAAALVARDAVSARRVLVLGVYSALLTVFIYLPGILTSPVTRRGGTDILNDQFLNMDIGDLATSPITTALTSVRGYWGDLAPVPLQYVTWLLPLVLVLVLRGRPWLSGLFAPFAVTIFTLALVVGPSVIGPIRYPARMMPYAVLGIAVLLAVLFSRGWPGRPSRPRTIAVLAITALSGWLAWAAQPASWGTVLLAVALQVGVCAAVLLPWRGRSVIAGTAPRAALSLLVGSVIVLLPQIDQYPSSPLGNFNVPSSASQMKAAGNDMASGILAVGDVYSLQRSPESYNESLLANLWYLTGKDAAGVYTVLPFTTFSEDLCIDLRGWTCADALDDLFEDDDRLVDDMALNTVVVIKGEGLESTPEPGPGWRVEEREYTWLLSRIEPVAPAGGIVRTTDGVSVTEVSRDETSVSFRVDSAPAVGGEVVFSRLAWPGYLVDGATLVDPERGYLLTTRVDADAVGTVVTVSFTPPGWAVEVGSALAALLLALVAGVLWEARRRALRVSAAYAP
ncbi:hypothetical protein [uncultured Microbacterium sp.]|uniref:hypothetical protein n=1 Tax=uncultured Microbacterium sp. TaxID=191216 RepID=UPI002605A6A3|nr:hypothetical protein [uncultured Microbacterium sp.]